MSRLAEKYGLVQSVYHISTASTNAVVLAEGPLILCGFSAVAGASARWVRFYDLNRVPLASDEPKFTVRLSTSAQTNVTIPEIFLENGLAMRITANGAPPTAYYDDTAITAGDVFINVFYRRVVP